jgi:hypothetical protein
MSHSACGKLDCQQLARLWRLFTYDNSLLLLLFLSRQPRHAEEAFESDKWRSANTQALLAHVQVRTKSEK